MLDVFNNEDKLFLYQTKTIDQSLATKKSKSVVIYLKTM